MAVTVVGVARRLPCAAHLQLLGLWRGAGVPAGVVLPCRSAVGV